jgi:hypothetical protein
MFSMLSGVDLKIFTPRHYVIGDTDKIGENKMTNFEKEQAYFFYVFHFL